MLKVDREIFSDLLVSIPKKEWLFMTPDELRTAIQQCEATIQNLKAQANASSKEARAVYKALIENEEARLEGLKQQLTRS